MSCWKSIRYRGGNWHAVCVALDVIRTSAQNVTIPPALAKTGQLGRPGLHSRRAVNGLPLRGSMTGAQEPAIVSLLMRAH